MNQTATVKQVVTRKETTPYSPTLITITSGKGGVGKTNLTANLAIALAQQGKNVLVFDADLGLANIDVMLGLHTTHTIKDVLEGRNTLQEIIVEGPAGIKVLPACSGIEKLAHMNTEEKILLKTQLSSLNGSLDFVLIDTSAGISSNVIYFNLVSHKIIVVITPEPTSITDAYALIKILSQHYNQKEFQILVNEIANAREGQQVFESLTRVTDKFLDISVRYLGFLYKDPKVRKAIRRQKAILEAYPESIWSKTITELSREIGMWSPPSQFDGGLGFFEERMIENINFE